MCNKLAKNRGGICNWQELNHDEELANYPAADIWGIGPSKAALLRRQGITTALTLKHYPLHKAKKHLTIAGMRTVQELNGEQAIDKIDTTPRQVVMVSRSFQHPVYELSEITAALAEYTQEAVKRIREENLSCRYISVYLMTNAYADGDPYYNQLTAEVPHPTAYLPEITAAANELLKRIYRPNYKYRKVMIGLTGLGNDPHPQLDLFDTQRNIALENEPLMQTFDTINNRYGRAALKLACALHPPNCSLLTVPYFLKRDYLSPRYTTHIKEIPVVY